MKRTVEMITMTLIIIVVAAFVGSTLMGCGGDDDSIIAISNDDGVRGGEVYNQWGNQKQTLPTLWPHSSKKNCMLLIGTAKVTNIKPFLNMAIMTKKYV